MQLGLLLILSISHGSPIIFILFFCHENVMIVMMAFAADIHSAFTLQAFLFMFKCGPHQTDV